jgi:hypothetical protein
MGARKISRRKLAVNDRRYLWYVKEEYDSHYNTLHIVSEDKRFIVQYGLGQSLETPYVTVLGAEFIRTAGTGGPLRRFRCPRWENELGVITTHGVRKLIEWCGTKSDDTREVDSAGRAVPLGGCCAACGVSVYSIPLNSDSCQKCGHPIRERLG